MCTGLICAKLKWKNKYAWWINNVNSVVCSMFNVKCSWDGLLEGRNCSCVWSFWCSELCSVDQMVTVQRGSVLDVRGPQWFCQPFCSLWISTVLGEWGGLYQWLAQLMSVWLKYSSKYLLLCSTEERNWIFIFGSTIPLSRCTQQGGTRNTQTRIYFKIIVFNDDIKVRQGKVDTQKHRE